MNPLMMLAKVLTRMYYVGFGKLVHSQDDFIKTNIEPKVYARYKEQQEYASDKYETARDWTIEAMLSRYTNYR